MFDSGCLTKEAQEILGVSKTQVLRFEKQELLNPVRLGRVRVFPRWEVEKLAHDRKINPVKRGRPRKQK